MQLYQMHGAGRVVLYKIVFVNILPDDFVQNVVFLCIFELGSLLIEFDKNGSICSMEPGG